MSVSNRRLEFLRCVADLSREAGGPVHYADVARKLAVSKWTAYDMLRELAAKALVRMSYTTSSQGLRGRSQVVFQPTDRGIALLEMLHTNAPDSHHDVVDACADDWPEVSSSLLSQVPSALEQGVGKMRILEAIDSLSPLSFCAAVLFALIVEFKRWEMDIALLEGILFAGTEGGSILPLATGMLAGALLVKDAVKFIPGFENLVKRFSDEVWRLSERNRNTLVDFAKKVVGQAWYA